MRGLARGATVERSETGERQMQALPATANAVRRKPDGRREPAKRGPRPRGPVPLDPQRGGKKPDFTSKITIRRFLRRNPAFSDLIPARLRGRGICLPQCSGFVTNAAFFRRGRPRPSRNRADRQCAADQIARRTSFYCNSGDKQNPPPAGRVGVGEPVRAKKACLFCFCCLQRSLF